MTVLVRNEPHDHPYVLCMARPAAFVIMLLLVLPGVAQAESWSPVDDVPGTWTFTLTDEAGKPGRLNNNETCRMTFTWWERDDGVSLIAKVYTCKNFSTAAKFAGLLASYDDRESRAVGAEQPGARCAGALR